MPLLGEDTQHSPLSAAGKGDLLCASRGNIRDTAGSVLGPLSDAAGAADASRSGATLVGTWM